MPPTTEARTRQLITRGLAPDATAGLVAAANQEGLLAEDAAELLAATTTQEQEDGRAFVLYSPLIPDWLRRAWHARRYPHESI